jgi:A/G-specific adenine glycosylase
MTSPLGRPQIERLRTALLEWYDARRRDLPWRRTTDPYAIWVSEVMLQQTTVATAGPRWQRFLDGFPSVQALAAAPEADVIAEWSGLGYYARARNLHAAARRIVTELNGEMPRSFEVLLALPGMGRYTAAAVASIAFGEPVAALDANVERVLARLESFGEDVRTPTAKRHLWERAQAMLAVRRAGDWNQAMMELGAVVCLPRAPQCPSCPAGSVCRARATLRPEQFPVKSPKPPMESVREVAAVLRRGEHLLVLQRPPRGSFAGMWEVPRGVARDGEDSRDAVVRIVHERVALDVKPTRPLLRLSHTVMRRRIDLAVWQVELLAPGEPRMKADDAQRAEWLLPADWLHHPASTTQRDIARYLAEGIVPEKRRQGPREKPAG